MLKSFQHFLVYIFICLSEIFSSFRMSENYIFNTCVCKHIRGDFACVSAFLLKIHILSANLDIGTLCCFYNRNNVDSRYAEYYVYFVILYQRFQSFH